MNSYLSAHISSSARKYTTNARGSKSNDDSVRRICYNSCNEELVGSEGQENTILTGNPVAYFQSLHS